MRKIMGFLAVLMATALASGCGNGEDEKIEVKIGMWPEPNMTEDVAMFNEWKRLFEEEHPQYEIIGDPYTYQVDTFAAKAYSRTLPTVYQTWFTEPEKIVKGGHAKDITAMVQELGWYDDMDPEMRDTLSFEGKLYGIPRDGYGLGLFINLEIFEMVGLVDDWNNDGILDIVDAEGNPRYPTTMQELREMSAYITTTINDYYDQNVAGLVILSANYNGGWQFSNLAWNFGAHLQVQQEGVWMSNLNDPKAVEALQWIKDLRWEDGSIPQSAALTYSDWYSYVGSNRAAMAFVGNDVISLPITNFEMNRNSVAFVPMPEGPYGDQYTLFGGTPYMFSSYATDEEVEGALLFLEYMGRSPEVSEIAIASMRTGMNVARDKGMPILPTIKPWVNTDYLEAMEQLELEYVNVTMTNFDDFYGTVMPLRRSEEPYYCQEMYLLLDSVLQSVLSNQNADPQALLDSADAAFQTQYMNNVG